MNKLPCICCDFRESPDAVMEQVNEILSKHKLAFVQVDDGSDTFIFALQELDK